MKNVKKPIVLAIILLFFTSCSSVQVVEEQNSVQVTDRTEEQMSTVMKHIESKDYTQALIELYNVPNFKTNPQYQYIEKYINASWSDETNSIPYVVLNLNKIPDSYSGQYSVEINKLREKYTKEIHAYNELSGKIKTADDLVGFTDVQIKQLFGNPSEILKTNNETMGKNPERWQYTNHGYLYFANGKVWQVVFKENWVME